MPLSKVRRVGSVTSGVSGWVVMGILRVVIGMGWVKHFRGTAPRRLADLAKTTSNFTYSQIYCAPPIPRERAAGTQKGRPEAAFPRSDGGNGVRPLLNFDPPHSAPASQSRKAPPAPGIPPASA